MFKNLCEVHHLFKLPPMLVPNFRKFVWHFPEADQSPSKRLHPLLWSILVQTFVNMSPAFTPIKQIPISLCFDLQQSSYSVPGVIPLLNEFVLWPAAIQLFCSRHNLTSFTLLRTYLYCTLSILPRAGLNYKTILFLTNITYMFNVLEF